MKDRGAGQRSRWNQRRAAMRLRGLTLKRIGGKIVRPFGKVGRSHFAPRFHDITPGPHVEQWSASHPALADRSGSPLDWLTAWESVGERFRDLHTGASHPTPGPVGR